MFPSKFLVNTNTVMKRIGKDAEGYGKLSYEFTENLEKASTFIRLLVKEAPDDVKKHFTSTYFGMTHGGLNSLMELLYDITWLKNWKLTIVLRPSEKFPAENTAHLLRQTRILLALTLLMVFASNLIDPRSRRLASS